MLQVKEWKDKSSSSTVYNLFLIDDETGEESLVRTVNVSSIHKVIKNKSYYLLYNSELVPISPAFQFINYSYEEQSEHSQILAVSALKLLYSYLEIFGLSIEELTKDELKKFKQFLRGMSPDGAIISFDLSTTRSAVTINGYLSVYRKYVTYLGITDSVLLDTKKVTEISFISPGSEMQTTVTQYTSNERVPEKGQVPAYISVRDFQKILKVIRDEYSDREECIVRLMFEGGLRIGEILGLTSEDVRNEHIINERTGAEFDAGVVYIRNRFTDKKYQHAKRRVIVTNRKQYTTNAYIKDWQKAYVSTALVDKIDDYINDTHDDFYRVAAKSKDKFNDNYKKYTITDIVNPRTYVDKQGIPYDDNYYIFINSIGKPLNISTWNDIMREIFIKAGIKVDTDVRKNNLNHRFRHGFAMYLVHYHNINPADLKKALRHRSLSSVMIYYNPTDDDIAEVQAGFTNSLLDVLPDILSDQKGV